MALKVSGRLWPIAEIRTNPKKRKANEAKNDFLVFISAPVMVFLPVVRIPKLLIPDQNSSRSGGSVVCNGCVISGSCSGSRRT